MNALAAERQTGVDDMEGAQMELIPYPCPVAHHETIAGLGARTIEQQTGWKRSHPEMICQDLDVLLRITELSYDLNDMNFVHYFEGRTGHKITKCVCGWAQVKKSCANPNLPAEPVPDISWQYRRGRLQDSWELYKIWEAKGTDSWGRVFPVFPGRRNAAPPLLLQAESTTEMAETNGK